MFEKCLVEDLYVPSAKARAITRSLAPTEAFCKGVFVPFQCDVRSAKGGHADLQSLSYALGLADDEPDTLVWSTFGLIGVGQSFYTTGPVSSLFTQSWTDRLEHSRPKLCQK